LKVNLFFKNAKNQYVNRKIVIEIVRHILKCEEKKLGEISIIFTNNETILLINNNYLKHNYYTDVIAFNNNKREHIFGEIYISIDQVKINAEIYSTSIISELTRVIIHGVLHLIGYNDKSTNELVIMKEREEHYLRIYRGKVSK
jgi:probable rRNA maturation factor